MTELRGLAMRHAVNPFILISSLALAAAPAIAFDGGVARAGPGSVGPVTTLTPPGWRLDRAVEMPRWLSVTLEERLRFETMTDDFRTAAKVDGTALAHRLLVNGEARLDPFCAAVELADSRLWATSGTLLNNTLVDPLELLRFNAGVCVKGLVQPGDSAVVAVGRMTVDVGSRRLLARNDYRNTVNSFTGLDAQYVTVGKHTVRGFVVVPVTRLPASADALANNQAQLNLENFDQLVWGATLATAPLFHEVRIDALVLGLHERDGVVASSNRSLVTVDVRLWRASGPGRLDFQLEGMVQGGASRASTATTDELDLQHLAGAFHAQVGYRASLPGSPRFALAWDSASGDADPNDDQNNRFDPLYAARRFEWGPSGLYGALSRSNIHSPAARLELTPWSSLDGFVAWRAVWLASARDAWVVAGLRDKTGEAGTFVGHQLEGRVRFLALPRNLTIEVGVALFFGGDFTRATQPREWNHSTYVYTQCVVAL